MTRLNDFFKQVYCIYLEKRAKDWTFPGTGEIIPGCLPLIQKEFSDHNIEVQYIPGIDGETLQFPETMSSDGESIVRKGDLGCTRSHLKVLETAISQGLENYFVFESDVVLHQRFEQIFDSFIKQVPDDWDMIYLGANHDSGFRYLKDGFPNYDYTRDTFGADLVVRMIRSFTTHAIGIRNTVYERLREVWSRVEKVDVGIADLHREFNCYCIRPHIAWQRVGYSDILGRLTNYDHLRNEREYEYNSKENLWKIKPIVK